MVTVFYTSFYTQFREFKDKKSNEIKKKEIENLSTKFQIDVEIAKVG